MFRSFQEERKKAQRLQPPRGNSRKMVLVAIVQQKKSCRLSEITFSDKGWKKPSGTEIPKKQENSWKTPQRGTRGEKPPTYIERCLFRGGKLRKKTVDQRGGAGGTAWDYMKRIQEIIGGWIWGDSAISPSFPQASVRESKKGLRTCRTCRILSLGGKNIREAKRKNTWKKKIQTMVANLNRGA